MVWFDGVIFPRGTMGGIMVWFEGPGPRLSEEGCIKTSAAIITTITTAIKAI